MQDGSLNATEIAVGSLLAGNRGYGNGGAWGGGYYGEPAFSVASNGVRVNRNLDCTKEQSDCTRMAMGLNLDRISDQNLETRNILRSTSSADRITNFEFRNGDRLRDLEREMNANARESAKCCCDTKLELLRMQNLNDRCCCETQKLIVSENAKTRDLINQNKIRELENINNTNATVLPLSQSINAMGQNIVNAIQANCRPFPCPQA